MAIYIDRSTASEGRYGWCVLFTKLGIVTREIVCAPINIRRYVPFRGLPIAYKPFHSN